MNKKKIIPTEEHILVELGVHEGAEWERSR